jgi:hypothetical protein
MPVVVTNLKTDIPDLMNAFDRFFTSYNPNTLTISNINLMRKDPTISLGLGMISEPIKGLNYKYEVDETEEIGKKQLEYLQLFLDPFIRELSSKILLALEYGRNSMLKVYKNADMDGQQVLVPADFVNPKPENVELLEDKWKRYSGLKYDDLEYDKSKTVHAVWGGEFREEALYGNSILDPTYQTYYRYQIAWLQYARYLEKQAAATVKVLYPPDEVDADGATTNYQSDATALGEGLKSGSTVAMSSVFDTEGRNPLWDAEYLEAPTNGAEFINYMDKSETLFLRSILIPDAALTRPGGATGTFAESKERADLYTTALENKSQWRDGVINTQVIDQLITANFGDDAIPIKLVSEPIIDEDRMLLGKLFEKTVGQDARGKEILIQEFAARYNADLDEIMELIVAKNEILAPEMPEQPDNKPEQPSGGQQEQDDIEMEAAIQEAMEL